MKPMALNEFLSTNSYPGRGIIIGMDESATHAVIAYFIMGRSENSRNRVFLKNGDGILIKPYDESKVSDPSLIIYSPLRVWNDKTIVTNGDQTDTIYDGLAAGTCFEDALESRTFEPDAPNYTPRISGMVSLEPKFAYCLNILKQEDAEAQTCGRYTYRYEPIAGKGHFIHTYQANENPLPSFTGEPRPVIISGDIDAFTAMLWENLNEENKISLAVRYIDLKTGAYEMRLCNKYC